MSTWTRSGRQHVHHLPRTSTASASTGGNAGPSLVRPILLVVSLRFGGTHLVFTHTHARSQEANWAVEDLPFSLSVLFIYIYTGRTPSGTSLAVSLLLHHQHPNPPLSSSLLAYPSFTCRPTTLVILL